MVTVPIGNIGIALSGGGARGAAHIGVLQALNELGVFPDHISGSSAGALVGALYAVGYTPKEIQKISESQSFMKIFHLAFSTKGLTNPRFLDKFLRQHLPEGTFKSLEIPLYVCATNIDKGEFRVLSDGDLIKAVMASCAIPLLFKPVEIEGELYVDGGLMNNLPIEPLKKSCAKFIGVGVCPHVYHAGVKGITDIGLRSFQLAIWNTMEYRMKKCGLAIDVHAVSKYGMFDFKNSKDLHKLGYDAVMEQQKEVEEFLGS